MATRKALKSTSWTRWMIGSEPSLDWQKLRSHTHSQHTSPSPIPGRVSGLICNESWMGMAKSTQHSRPPSINCSPCLCLGGKFLQKITHCSPYQQRSVGWQSVTLRATGSSANTTSRAATEVLQTAIKTGNAVCMADHEQHCSSVLRDACAHHTQREKALLSSLLAECRTTREELRRGSQMVKLLDG